MGGAKKKTAMATTTTRTVNAHLADLAVIQTRQHGAGVLWVASNTAPQFRPLAQVEPPAFREMVQKTWDSENATHAFIVVHDKNQLHMVKVPKPLDADADAVE